MARKKSGGERIEPTFDASAPNVEPEARAQPEAEPKPTRKKATKAAAKPKKRSRSLLGGLVYWIFVLGVWGVIGAGGLAVYYGSQLPAIDQLAVPKRPPNIAILAVDGTLLANRGDTGGAAVRLQDLPPYLPKAFVAIEDRRFYSHYGVDPIGIARAVARNITGRGGMQGGSTLTQQLAKNLFLTQERTVSRKIQEAILALWLERKYSKDQILELYLNRVYFGSGAYGVDAAALKYFGHPAKDVTLAEAAMLAGLMKSPSKLAPNHYEKAAIERADQVVAAMAQEGHITEAMAKLALAKPAHAVKGKDSSTLNYAADYVMDVLDETIGAIDEDIVVTSTINPAMQASGERALNGVLARDGGKFGVTQGALVSLDSSGAIRALIGGRNYEESQFNRAVSARRQPGSSFKPFVYLTALEKGLTPDSTREDAPINVKGWQPENSSHRYMGEVNLTTALALSLNTVAVRLGLEVGPRAVIDTAHRLGVTSKLDPNASIALGTSVVSPLELVTAYVPLANGGIGVQNHIITKVRTADGKLLYARRGSSNGRVIDPTYVAMMNSMLEQTLIIGTARKADLPGWEAAGKTGTSQDYRDAWFVGYTSQLTTGVWLGNDDNSPTKKASGANLPVDIWSRFMREALKGQVVAGLPTGGWRSENLGGLPSSLWPQPEAPQQQAQPEQPVQHLDTSNPGAPVVFSGAGRGASAPREQQVDRAPRFDRQPQFDRDEEPIPPADIPDGPLPRQARDDRNFLDRLFSDE
ncbi:penicillin-binding protein [Rhodoblastus sphagnicola]|uniref:Penicillin-binding protein n=1 Tax=Rhodoblastus sphagnicola TaxID=333368 RepID=A0A2S6N4Q3_9HYPH|nr:PBP1A family penicillin-binding protein [Rhodoblastus sphagnicola]MBB4199587.1 penicillin-binding protein 1A [Rhodoblastus sphagnicola]PPQ29595.1 penicillin-binding protein [Rhodoblastus sphagnicola]